MALRVPFRRVAAVATACILGALALPAAGVTHAEAREPGPLKMEEVEVRGYREKPGRLFLPVPRPVYSPSPVRFDLFREDIARPIPPGEIPHLGGTEGGSIDDTR